nr:MAG TPA: nuclease [Caudoviricetes sp.]
MTNNDLAVELLQQRKKKREDPQSAATQTSTQSMSGQAALAQELLSQRIQARKEREAAQPTVSLPSQRIDPAKERQESKGKFNGWKYFENLGKTLLAGAASISAATGAMAEDAVTSVIDTIFQGANTKGSGLFNALYHGRPDWKFLGENGLVGIEQNKAYLDAEREEEVSKINDSTIAGKAAKKAASYGGDIAYGVGGAIPMAMTAGVAAVAPIVNGVATSTEALANLGASVVESSGILSTLGKGFRDTLTSKNYWTAFASEVGSDYQEALSDGASTSEAMNYAIGTSLLNSVIEIGGGIQNVPKGFSVKNLLRSAAEEGMEEIWQGPVGRTMQNVVYGADNPIASLSDDRAIFNPVTSAQEFAEGFAVGGILSGAQMAAGKAADSVYNKQIEKQSKRYEQAQQMVRDRSGVKGTYQTQEDGKTTVGGSESAIKSIVKGGQIEMETGDIVSPDKVTFADRNTADLYEGAINRAANAGAANVFVDSYAGGDVSRYLLGMQEAYEDGRAGVVTEKRGTFADDLTDAQRTAAWNQGAADGLQSFRSDTGLGENGSAAWTQVQQNQAVRSNPRLRTGFTSMYQAGLSGKALTDVKSDAAKYIPPSVQTAAYQAGLADAASSLAREKAGVKLVTRSGDAGLADNDYSRNLANKDAGTARVLGALASDMGVRIEIVPQVQGGAANGKYVSKTNTIQLAADADNPLTFVAAHEVTHRMQDAAPTEYHAYRDAVMAYRANELGDDTAAHMVERYRDASREAGVTLTQEEAMDEIAADFTAEMLNDADLFERFAAKNRTAAKTLLDRLKEFISKVKGLVASKRNKAAQEAYGKNFAELQKIADLWQTAYDKAAETVAGTSDEAETNADGTSKMQIRKKYWRPDLNRSEWNLLNRRMTEEIESSEQYLDESTKWLYADEKGVQVFALYGIGDGTEATPLYASGGKAALSDHQTLMAARKEFDYGFNRGAETLNRVFKTLRDKQRKSYGSVFASEEGSSADGYGRVSTVKGDGNGRGSSGAGAQDQRGVKEKFSLRAPVEQTKDLVAVHNLTEQNLRDAMKLGGLPMPSIAVVKAAQGHSMYGPISIVFGRESIDPQTDSRNKIYGGDAYTPTAPAVEYPVNYDRMRAVEKRLARLSEKVAGGVFRNDSALQRAGVVEESSMSAPELADKLARDDSIRAAYLADHGKTLEPVMQAKEFNRYGNDALAKLVQKIGVQELGSIEASMETGDYQPVREIEDTVRQIIRDSYEEQHRRFLDRKPEQKEKRINYFMENNVHTYTVENFVRNAWEYYQDQGATTSEIDRWATSDKLHEAASAEAVKAWLLPQLEGVLGEPGIYNGSERFDRSGNRRSFSQLHWGYTLENIVRAMTETQAERGGQTFGASAKAMQAVSTEDFQSIDAVKAASGRLGNVDTEQYKADVDAVEKRIEQATRAVMRENKAHSDNQFDEMQIIGDVMMQAAQGKQTEAAIRRAFSQEGYSISESTAREIREEFRAAAELPTGYFEAKPQRAVGFNEVLAAVIPDNSSAEIRQSLSDAGVRVIEYPAGDETGRLNAVNSVDNARFQLKSQTQIDSEMRDIKKERDRLKTRVKSLERQVARWKAEVKPSMPSFREGDLKKLGNRLISDFDSSTKYSEIKTDMENIGKALLSQDVPDTDLHAYAEYVAEKIIQNSRVLEEGGEDLLEIQKHLKSVKLAYTDDGSIPDFLAWKKEHRDIKFAKDGGLPVDVAYHELTELFGGGYFPENIVHPADQLTRMGEVLEDIDSIWSNPYDEYRDIAIKALGNALIEGMISDDVRQTRPTYADRKEQEIAHLKDLLSKTRAGRDEKIKQMRTAYAERTKAGAERRKAREIRAKISRHTETLSRKLLRPTDKQHIPESLRMPVAALLRSINMESARSYDENGRLRSGNNGTPTKRTQDAIRLREAYDSILSNDPNFVIDPALFGGDGTSGFIDQLVQLGNQRIDEMNTAQLNVIWKAIKGIETTITSYDKALASGKYMFISQWANDLRSGVSSRKRTNKKAALSLYDPRTFFNAYGDAGLDVFRALRNAEDTQNRRVAEVAKLTEKFMSREVYKQRNERHTFTTEGGQTITLTNDQIMNLYNLANRGKHSMQHLSVGGVIQPYIKRDGKLPAIERGTKSIPLTASDVAQITDVLTDEQIKVAKGLQKIASTMLAKWGNESSMAVYGYNKFTEEHYWPIKSAREAIVQNAERGENMPREIRNMGSAKALNENASNALDLGGVFDVFTKNASDMITYSTMLEPMEDINRLFNYRYRDSAGNLTGKNVKNVLTDVYGEQALKYWRNLMSDVQNGIAHDDEPITRMIEKLVGRTKAASVGMNARVVLQQPTAFFRAAAIIDPSDMAKGLVKAPTKGNGWKKAKQYAGIAAIKDSSGFDQAGQYTIMKGILNGADQTFMDKLSDASSAAAAKADAVTWGKIWNACEYTVQKEGRYEVGSEEFYTRTAEVFSDVIDQSQVVDGILQRTQIMRSGNGLTKQATAFMGEPMKSLNMLLRAYDAWRYETNPSKKSAALKQFARTSIALLVTDGVNALVQSLVDAARKDDKDKDYWGRYFEVLTGVTGEDDTVVSVLLGSNLWDNIDPVGRIPFAKDIKSMLQGYTVSRMDADAVSDFISAAQLFTKAAQGDGQKTPLYAFKQLLVTGSKIFGVSVGNIGRDTWAVARSIAQETGSYWAMYQMEQMIYRVAPDAKNTSRYYSILYHALQDDKAAYDRIYADLISKGYTDKQIKTGMKNAIKNAGGSDMLSQLEDVGFSREDAETVIKQQEFKQSYGFSYDDLADEYADGNISRREVIRALQNVGGLSAEDAELKATVYDWKNAGVSDATNSIVKAYQSYGSEAGFDKKTFAEAYKDLNAVKGEDTDGDGKIEKKQFVLEAINKMNISTAQKDALYRMKGYGEKQLADAPWH